MLSFFKRASRRLSGGADATPSISEAPNGQTVIDQYKMSLDERKAWRFDMIRISVREILASFQFSSGMYRYRVLALDERGHYYVVMIDTTKGFENLEYVDLVTIEKALQEHTVNNYGVVVDAVYWKANQHVNMFRRATDNGTLLNQTQSRLIDPSDTDDVSPHQPLGAEMKAFRQAVDSRLSVTLEVDGKEYSTDLAPLVAPR